MADFRDSLSLSLDDILAAAHKLAVEQSPEAGEIENQTTMNATETQPAQTTQPSQASAPAVENDHQSIEVPAETPIKPAAPTQQSSGFNFVFEPEAIERLESLLNGASQSEPAPQGSLSAVESVAPAPEATPAPSAGSSPVPVQSTAPAPAAVADISEKRSAAPSMVMTGIVSDYAQPNQQPAQQAQPAPQQQAQQQPAPQQQSAPVQQPVQQQQSTQQPVAQQQPVVQQPVQQQQQQPTQQQPASQQQPIQQSYAQAEAPAQSCPAPDTQPQTVQPEPEPPADNDASIEVISALPAIPRAFTSELDQDPAPDPIQTSAHAKQPEPLRSRQEQRAAQRAAEIAAGQREPSHSHPTGGEGRHANPAGTEDDSAAQGNQSRPLDNVVPPRSSARQRRSHNELASQAEVRSWEQAGVQRAALEFLKNSRREYGKSQDSQDVAQPYPADSGFTQPIKLNPVEATSAVSEARRAEVEQKVFVNSQPVTSAQDQDSREYTAAPAAAPANTPATTIDAPPDLLPDMPMSAPIDPDNNDMSWVDASRPEWTELPTKKSRRNKKKHEPEEEPVHEKKSKRQRKESEKATKHDRIAEDEQFRSALTN
ncbi:MAG: hypothetical protein RR547_06995, partial [Raoultibacter sp.]